MASKYYENPFDDDDDDVCFAEVEVEEIVIEETPCRPSEEYHPNRQPQRSVPTHPRPQISSGHPRNSYPDHQTTRNVQHYREEDRQEEHENREEEYPVVTHTTPKKPSHTEHFNTTTPPPTTAAAATVTTNSHMNSQGGIGSRKQELRIDDMTQSLSQLRRQMDEVHHSKTMMAGDYEEHIRSLREELERVNAERNELLTAQSKLESELRTLRAEKENNSFLYRQEKERNEVLSGQVARLELELRVAEDNHQRMLQELHESHQEELARSTRISSSRPATSTDDVKVGTRRGPQFQPPRQRPFEPLPEDDVPSTVSTGDTDTGVEPFHGQDASISPAMPSPTTGPTVRARGKGNTTASSWSIGEEDATSKSAHVEKTEKEKEIQREIRMREVEALEAQLLAHSRSRDELRSQLTRMENTRIRNAVERQKKALVEEDLQEEERAIGQIRLKLRSMEALFR